MTRFQTIHGPPMLDKTADNSDGLGSSRPTLIQGKPIQLLDRRFDVLSRSFPIKFPELHLVNRRNNQDNLTELPLLDLLGSKTEGRH